jgi:hypothetical protein
MKRKMAVVTLELVGESIEETDRNIAQELFDWFMADSAAIPWVKSVKGVMVKDS